VAQNGWTKIELDVKELAVRGVEEPTDFVFEIRADRTWQPCSTDPASSDNRELSVAICNIEITQ
jgi:hypothetical protein